MFQQKLSLKSETWEGLVRQLTCWPVGRYTFRIETPNGQKLEGYSYLSPAHGSSWKHHVLIVVPEHESLLWDYDNIEAALQQVFATRPHRIAPFGDGAVEYQY